VEGVSKSRSLVRSPSEKKTTGGERDYENKRGRMGGPGESNVVGYEFVREGGGEKEKNFLIKQLNFSSTVKKEGG